MITHAEAARILSFETPTPLPRGGSWTARMTGCEPDRMQRFFFAVTHRAADGSVTTFEVAIPDEDPADAAAWTNVLARASRDLGFRIRDHLGIGLDEAPRG